MNKIFNKIKQNIFIYDLAFIGISILINVILYLMNMRFRLWFILLIIVISIVGFIVGAIQQLFRLSKNKKVLLLITGLCLTLIIIPIIVFFPIIRFVAVFSYKPEHTTQLDNKKYVAVVNSFLHVDAYYYNYYGPLLMGTKVKVHADFGKGGYDPFVNPNVADGVEYIYYDNNGKIKSKRSETFVKDKDGNIVDKNIYNNDINSSDESYENDNYILPENEEVLYEKKFNKVIMRFSKVDNTLGQNMLVNVLRSKDNGKNFYVISDDVVQVSNDSKFVFLNENLGFIVSLKQVYLNNGKTSLYVTNDSGKTFKSAVFNYTNENVDFIDIESLPYIDKELLKIKCSVYQVNKNKDGYENKELIFVSRDNGLNWNLNQ